MRNNCRTWAHHRSPRRPPTQSQCRNPQRSAQCRHTAQGRYPIRPVFKLRLDNNKKSKKVNLINEGISAKRCWWFCIARLSHKNHVVDIRAPVNPTTGKMTIQTTKRATRMCEEAVKDKWFGQTAGYLTQCPSAKHRIDPEAYPKEISANHCSPNETVPPHHPMNPKQPTNSERCQKSQRKFSDHEKQ